MSGTGNTAIGGDVRSFLVDGSANVCVGDKDDTGLGARLINRFAIDTPGAGTFALG